MGMNQPTPEQLQGMQQKQPMEGLQQDPSSSMNQQPMAQDESMADPMEALPMVVLSYLDFATEMRNDKTLALNVRSQAMLQMAQAINYLVPLLPKTDPTQEMDMQMKVAEFEMKSQAQQEDLQMQREKHQMELEFKQADMQLKQQENQMKLQQQSENHQQQLVQKNEAHKSSMEQQKQAAQLKQSQKPTSDKGKK
jgi:hypothetical protein